MNAQSTGIWPGGFLLSASVLWGVSTVLSKSSLSTIAPVPLLFIQLLASCTLLLPLCLLLRRRPIFNGRLLRASLLGILNPGISYTFSMMALERIPASAASMFWAMEPLLILGLAAVVLGEKITKPAILVIFMGVVGALLVSGAFATGPDQPGDLLGSAYMATAVGLCAVYTVASRRFAVEMDPLVLVALQQVAGLIWTGLLMAALANDLPFSPSSQIPVSALLVAAVTGILYYGIAYWLYLGALAHVNAAFAGASFNIIPVVAIAVAYVFLGERLSGSQLVGATLILTSGLMLVWYTRRPEAAS